MHYKQIETLKYLIKRGDIPENVDWVEIYNYWLHRDDIKPKIKREYSLLDIYKQRARTMNYRARKIGVDGKVEVVDLIDVMRRCNNRCVKCGSSIYLVFDHIVSMYRGGLNTKDNLQVLCRLCNMEKGVNK